MLQSNLLPQLARVKSFAQLTISRSLLVNPDSQFPLKDLQRSVKMEQSLLKSYRKHWYCGGRRSLAAAVNLLQDEKIIAIPTDTIYGLAGLAQNKSSVTKLYDIKQRDPARPLAICCWDVSDISRWAHTEDLPEGLLESLLPGPVTVVLKRKPRLNKSLNPGVDSVGIRVPNSPFLRTIVKKAGAPLALTSANESNKPSTLYAEEFKELWPFLGGIFYPRNPIKESSIRRAGSTIVDLTTKGEFRFIRIGRAIHSTRVAIQKFGWKQVGYSPKKEEEEVGEDERKIRSA